LTQAHKSLQSITTPEQVRLTVEALILENEKMRNKAKDLDQRLEQARGQIDSLRSNLAEAEEISMKDPLTSLSNRRSFDQALQREISEAQKNRSQLCLIMGDIDHFKRINDTFGHLVGDAVLKRFAELLAKSAGVNDTVARFGGEEFALILPGVGADQAKAIAEGIRRTLESKKWVATDGGLKLGTVTASFGVSEMRPDDEPEDLVRRADGKLYEAKCAGRNKVIAEVRLAA
jgi:diguanylate cyclase